MMTNEDITKIGQLLASQDVQLFATQYQIGKIIVASVGTDLTPGMRKGEPSHHGRKGFRRLGGLNTACSELARAYNRRGRSVAWFKACYYMAKNISEKQYQAILAQQATQDAILRIVYRPPTEIDAAIAKGNLGQDSRRKQHAEKPTDAEIHGGLAPYYGTTVVIDTTWDPERIADTVGNAITRIPDPERRQLVRENIIDVMRRVRT